MSYIGSIKTLYNHLRKALKWAHVGCRVAAHLNTAIQTSNASDALKTQASEWVTSTNNLCAAVEAFIAALPGN